MKKIVSLICVFAMGMAVAGLFAGCGAVEEDRDPGVAVAIVIGVHRNSKQINLSDPALESLLEKVVQSYGEVSIVVPDGAPENTLVSISIVRPSGGGYTAAQLERFQQAEMNRIKQCLSLAAAKTPEVDSLAALTVAKRALSNAPGPRYIYMAHTGISTAGALRLQHPGMLEQDPTVVADYLESLEAIPDLSEIDELTWAAFLDCSTAQKVPSHYHGQLRALWEEILARSGMGRIRFVDTAQQGDMEESSLPHVTSVAFRPAEDIPPVQMISIPESQLEFIADSADYRDPLKAEAILRPIAEILNAGTNRLVIAGTTASGDAETCYALSCLRAKKVAESLQALGVNGSRFEIYGLGFDERFCLSDRGPDGGYNGMEPENRRVIIFDAEAAAYSEDIRYIREQARTAS